MTKLPRASAIAGAKAAAPLAVPGVPFGMVLGVQIAEAGEVNNFVGWFSSILILAGASQVAAVSLLATGAGVVTTVLTIAVINARHMMYSAALSGRFQHLPRWFRLAGPYLMVDQVFAVADQVEDDATAEHRMAHYLGAGALLFTIWNISVAVGLLVGDAIPQSWSLGYAVPVMFLGLLILGLTNTPGAAAAVTGGVVAVLGRDFPNGSGLLAGAIAGVVVGGTLDWWFERRTSQNPAAAP
ncbi:MAG: branched-chain amino acid permease [Acidimicrobiales bacterium]|nr:branched-chain amino acid permease [Acidimicrobiales bacterium]